MKAAQKQMRNNLMQMKTNVGIPCNFNGKIKQMENVE